MLDQTQIILTLATVISGLTSYMAWFFRYSLKQSETREAKLWERIDTILDEIAKTVGQDAHATGVMAAQQTRVFDYVVEEQLKARLLLGLKP